MSLTSHLKLGMHSPIGAYLRTTFPNTVNVTKAANARLRAADVIIPKREEAYYSLVGMALDYRVRLSLASCNPVRLVAWQGAWLLVAEENSPYSPAFVDTFFARFAACLTRLRPQERHLSTEEEYELAGFVFALALWEEVFRSDRYCLGPLFVPEPFPSVEALVNFASDNVRADLAQLIARFHEKAQPELSGPYILNPTFGEGSALVGGADADLIADGVLIDCKCSITPRIDADWLRQALGYCLLDWATAWGFVRLASGWRARVYSCAGRLRNSSRASLALL
jgi:hypothetical protein